MSETLRFSPELRRQSLPEQVAVAILAALIDRRLKPGDALPPAAELAEQFGVSRTVVREAFADLMGRGVISRVLSREPIVSMPGPDQLRELLQIRISQDSITMDSLVELRLPLEVQSARLAASRHSEDQMKAIDLAFEALVEEDNEARFHDADIALHREIALASQNLLIPLVLDSLSGLLHDFRQAWYAAQRKEGKLPELVEEHRRIVEAIRSSDVEAAGSAMSDHLLAGLAKIRSRQPAEPTEAAN